MREKIVTKSCLCHDLAGGVTINHGIDPGAHSAICCGPNIVNFSKVVSLEEMVAHIYGRMSLLTGSDRPHMFIRELMLHVDYLQQELRKTSEGLVNRTAKWFVDFRQNLITGIEYYRRLAEQSSLEQKERFLRELDNLFDEINGIVLGTAAAASIKGTV